LMEWLEALAKDIDAAQDAADQVALKTAVAKLEAVDKRALAPGERGALYYYLGNALSGLRALQPPESYWAWSQPALEREILHFRHALVELTPALEAAPMRRQVFTNLANAFNYAGRVVEALDLWNRALELDKRFGMALANRGLALFHYAKYVDEVDEQKLVLRECRNALIDALKSGVEAHAGDSVKEMFEHVSSLGDWSKYEPPAISRQPKSSRAERVYREWCRRHGLVLSPLNDLTAGPDTEDIRDTLVLPSIMVPVAEGGEEPPVVYGMFNQAKQEYTAARYLVFEAIQERKQKLHFSDRGTVLFNALDYRLYRLWVERMKMAFLAAHAILDKLAYLMNEHWKLELEARDVSFSGVWYAGGKRRNGISPKLRESRNWPLRGLFWLSKDFYDRSDVTEDVAPEPRMLHEIRNHIAHKYLRVHDHLWTHLRADRKEMPRDFSFAVTDDELQEYTLKLLRLVRSAMVYLVAAVAHEEHLKARDAGEGLIGQMPIFTLDDDLRL
jgi:tetratricopeptide (TPR) repeat protein